MCHLINLSITSGIGIMTTSNDAESATDKAALRIQLESKVVDRSFCLETTSSKPLNITCYGSSSSKTPERYLEEARLLGYILSKRGHVCINGAGSFGCMAAMNDGVHAGDGHVRGVIHEMFLADNGYFDVDAKTQKRLMRRGSSHAVFENALILNREEQKQLEEDLQNKPSMQSRPSMDAQETEPIREILVAGMLSAHSRMRIKRVTDRTPQETILLLQMKDLLDVFTVIFFDETYANAAFVLLL